MLRPLYIEKFDFSLLPVEGSTFDMGDESEESFSWERPVHKVKIDTFFLTQYPVTQELWQAVMGNTPAHFTGGRRPVEQVSWDDAQVFLKKIRKATGEAFRLPTEAEWEYAARGGVYNTGLKYAGSNRLKEVAWYETNSHGETKPAGWKFRNELGLYDMTGNVWEWCADWYEGRSYYESCKKQGVIEDPTGPEKGIHRVYRGGSWANSPRDCRSAYRISWPPDLRLHFLGFRLALSLQSVG